MEETHTKVISAETEEYIKTEEWFYIAAYRYKNSPSSWQVTGIASTSKEEIIKDQLKFYSSDNYERRIIKFKLPI